MTEIMKDYMPVLGQSPLFEGITGKDLSTLMECLSPRQKRFRKGQFIFLAGSEVTSIGIVLSGNVHIIREDYWGNRNIISACPPGDHFGEAFAIAGLKGTPLSVLAAETSEILFLNFSKVTNHCPLPCKFHTKVQRNIMRLLARKNIVLLGKIHTLTRPNMREKIMSYLSSEAANVKSEAKNKSFDIPFNREELAGYLSVNRSALSIELGKMRDEGLIEFRKNHFELKKITRIYS
jgi:CRP-like cAMP-binding protein